MSDLNPYSAPASDVEDRQSRDTREAITTEMVRSLKGMGPWVRLLAVLLFMGTALMACGGCGAMFGGVVGFPGQKASPVGLMLGAGLVYLLVGALYLLPALQLNRVASAAKRAEPDLAAQPLHEALDNLHRFFRTIGILFLVFVGLYLLIIIGALVAGAAGVLGGAH